MIIQYRSAKYWLAIDGKELVHNMQNELVKEVVVRMQLYPDGKNLQKLSKTL